MSDILNYGKFLYLFLKFNIENEDSDWFPFLDLMIKWITQKKQFLFPNYSLLKKVFSLVSI